MLWAFFGLFTGLGKLAVVLAVALVFFGRSGLPLPRSLRLLRPLLTLVRSEAAPTTRPSTADLPSEPQVRSRRPAPAAVWVSDRWFWFLTILAATAVASWVITRVMMSASYAARH